MGIIKAAIQTLSSGLADQWLEVIEPQDMGPMTLMTKGVLVNRKSSNKRGTTDVITDGSVIHVYDNQCMILTDGGKVIDYSAEPGYYVVDNKSAPSLFNGNLSATIQETFERIKFGGTTAQSQKVFYLNLQEIRGIKFGTHNPLNYFDSFYNAELFLRAHGTYSIRVVDPLKTYAEVCPRNTAQVEISDINDQFINEFLEALQTSINQMSADGIRISYVASKGRELSKYMAQTLDEEWRDLRGLEIVSVGIGGLSYDEESKQLINMRNKGAMLSDPTIREGFVQGSVAAGMEAAGSNANGAMAGFMGMGMGMQAGAGVIGAASQSNMQQMQQQYQQPQQQYQQPQQPQQQYQQPGQPQPAGASWTCSCGAVNTGKFCPNCGLPAPSADWSCDCGAVNSGRFCTNCGKPRP